MNTEDRLRYLDALQVCVNIATLNGYTPEQVANDIRLLITPPQPEIEVYAKLVF